MKTEQITTSKEEKIKSTVYISKDTLEKVNACLELAGVDSANKFYVKATERYLAELMLGDGNNFITETITEAVEKGCDKQLRYIADALFRYAVFGNVSIEMMARALNYDLDELNECYFARGTTITPDTFNFFCSRYRKHMGEETCTPHSIREVVLDEIVLEEIRRATYEARANTDEFVEFINKKSSSENRKELNAKTAELTKLTKRNGELNTLFKRLYEDNVLGKISNEQFRMLSQSYNDEQKEITERLPVLEQEIEHLKDTANNVERFVALAKRFVCIEELTPEILRTFISKIVIHEKSQKHSRKATQQIDIYFTHIGMISA